MCHKSHAIANLKNACQKIAHVHISLRHLPRQVWRVWPFVFYYWQFMFLKNRLQCNSTETLHRCQWQANLTFPIYCYQWDFVIRIYKWFIISQCNSFIKIAISHFIWKKHPLQRVGNLFKINLFLVCRNLVESAKAPVTKQLLCSEWKPMCKYLFHSFCHWCSRKLVYSSRHFKQKLISCTRLF